MGGGAFDILPRVRASWHAIDIGLATASVLATFLGS
jgi:hypothetical protein